MNYGTYLEELDGMFTLRLTGDQCPPIHHTRLPAVILHESHSLLRPFRQVLSCLLTFTELSLARHRARHTTPSDLNFRPAETLAPLTPHHLLSEPLHLLPFSFSLLLPSFPFLSSLFPFLTTFLLPFLYLFLVRGFPGFVFLYRSGGWRRVIRRRRRRCVLWGRFEGGCRRSWSGR